MSCHRHKTLSNVYVVKFLSTKAKINSIKAMFWTKTSHIWYVVSEDTSKWRSLNGSWQIQTEESQGQYPRTRVPYQSQEACILV